MRLEPWRGSVSHGGRESVGGCGAVVLRSGRTGSLGRASHGGCARRLGGGPVAVSRCCGSRPRCRGCGALSPNRSASWLGGAACSVGGDLQPGRGVRRRRARAVAPGGSLAGTPALRPPVWGALLGAACLPERDPGRAVGARWHLGGGGLFGRTERLARSANACHLAGRAARAQPARSGERGAAVSDGRELAADLCGGA